MKPVKKQINQALQNDPHGDTVALQMNPQEAQATAAFLKLMGGAGVRNPKTGLLQFYEDAGGEGGHGGGAGQGGHNDLGGGRGNGGGAGGGGRGGQMSPDDLRSWAPGTTDVPGNKTQIERGSYNPDNIGSHESYGYYGQAPTTTQNMLSRLGSFLGIGYHPNAINVGTPGYNETQSRVSIDPARIALGIGSMAMPALTPVSMAYGIANQFGLHAPQVGFNTGGTLNGPQSPSQPGQPNGAPGGSGSFSPSAPANVSTQTAQAAKPANTPGNTQSAQVAQLMQQYVPQRTIGQQVPGLLDYSQTAPSYTYPWYMR
jgi:hypothetical protein